MIKILKVTCLKDLDLGRAGKFGLYQKYLARFSKNNRLVFKTNRGVWVDLSQYIDLDDILEYFECYDDFYVDSYHQV